MTSVNTRQPSPCTVGNEISPAPAPTGPEGDAEASGRSDTRPDAAPPRNPVTPEQRGQFSSHHAIVNPKPPETAETRLLAELTQKNNQLLAKLNALVEKFEPQAQGKAAPDSAVAPASQPYYRLFDEQDETFLLQGTLVNESGLSRSLDTLTRENDEFRHMVKKAFEQFHRMLTRLQQLVGSLAHRVDTMDLPQRQIPTGTAASAKPVSSDDVQPEAPASRQNQVSVPANESTASRARTVEALKKENQALEDGLDAATAYYHTLISPLQQQIEAPVKNADKQKK
ncbi:hypothetical protein K2E96_11820 [Pseudomonas sp. ERGC3:05]|nr:hypothetical protein [Pseudomonas sp. ERGC3:01]QZC96596.1 hypothetical protein K2E96_11820 [Pseudomonas sp. ERGC3:05]